MPAVACRVALVIVIGMAFGVYKAIVPKTARFLLPAMSQPVADVDQLDEVYTKPMEGSTLRGEVEAGGVGKLVRVSEFFFEFRNVCQKGGTGLLYLAGAGGSETVVFRGEHFESIPLTVPRGTPPQDAIYHSDKILWSGMSFGTMTHIGHWAMYVAIPYLVFLKEYLGLHDEPKIIINAIVKEKNGYVYPVTSIFTNYTQPVDVFKPKGGDVCYRRGYLGFPTPGEDDMARFFTEKAHVYWQILRERLRAWAGVPFSARFPVNDRSGGLPVVTLTVRTSSSGFGRNLSNSREVKEHLDRVFEGVLSTQIISWNDHPLQEQIAIGKHTDIMVGVHGNNLFWMVVMDPGGVVIELLPYGAEGTTKGVNPAFGKFHNAFYSYIGQRANQTFLTWTASVPDHSPLAPPEEYHHKIFSHRCKKKSSRRWMCRHLAPPPSLLSNLINFSLPHLGRFTNQGYHGEFPFEKEQRERNETVP